MASYEFKSLGEYKDLLFQLLMMSGDKSDLLMDIIMPTLDDDRFDKIDNFLGGEHEEYNKEGKLEIVKIGAAVSFLKREDTVEIVSGDSLPAGVDLEQELKTIENEMDNGDFLVMVTDGVLEYLNVNDPKDKLCEIISDVSSDNSGVMAQEILDRVLLYTGGYAMDDMTVIVIGVWEK